MNETTLFGDDNERHAFEADAGKRTAIARVTQDALTPIGTSYLTLTLTPIITSYLI